MARYFVEADKNRTRQQEEEAQMATADAKGMDDSRIITVIPNQAPHGARGGWGRGRGASRSDSASRGNQNQEDRQERRSGSSLKAKSWLKQAGPPPPRTPTPPLRPQPTATTSVKSNPSEVQEQSTPQQ